MPVITQVYDAAHKYGLDNMGVSASLIAAAQAIEGSLIKQTNSWGEGPMTVGQPGTMTLDSSGGFTTEITLVYNDTQNGTITFLGLYKTGTNELLASSAGSVAFSTATWTTATQPQNALFGDDIIYGNSFNNILKGFGGSDRIDGGGGTDTAYFEGFSSQYNIAVSGNAKTVTGAGGTDTLLNIERIQFDDKAIAYDITGTGGQAYRLYQAAFNRAPDAAGLGFQMWAMDTVGWSLNQVGQGFIDSPEFTRTYGNLSNRDFVTQLYANVLHRAPDTAGLKFHTDLLDAGTITRATDLIGFSESPENQAALIGVIGNGFAYTPHA